MLVDQLTGSLCNLSHWLTPVFSSVHRHQNEPTRKIWIPRLGHELCYLQDRVDAGIARDKDVLFRDAFFFEDFEPLISVGA